MKTSWSSGSKNYTSKIIKEDQEKDLLKLMENKFEEFENKIKQARDKTTVNQVYDNGHCCLICLYYDTLYLTILMFYL